MTKDTAALDRIIESLGRCAQESQELYSQLRAYADLKPYTIRANKHFYGGRHYVRLVAIRNFAVDPPDPAIALRARNILARVDRALADLIHAVKVRGGNAPGLPGQGMSDQFPIFDTSHAYAAWVAAEGSIQGISGSDLAIIERVQPYSRRPDRPSGDELWVLKELNRTQDELAWETAIGHTHSRIVTAGSERKVVNQPCGYFLLEHDKELGGVPLDSDYADAELEVEFSCTVPFKKAVELTGMTDSVDHTAQSIALHAGEIVGLFR
jgi:hypothetical protein